MPAKIFPESKSLAEDKAKILFDYYKKAAEKIVAEEVDLEQKIAVCNEELVAQAAVARKKMVRDIIIGSSGILLLVLSIVLKFMLFRVLGLAGVAVGVTLFLIDRKKNKKSVEEIQDRITGFKEAHEAIRRDYKVAKLGVAYVPIASQVPFEGKSFYIDHTGSVPGMSFSLSAVRKPSDLNASIKAIRELTKEVPVVESSESAESVNTAEYSTSIQNVSMYDYLGELDREIRNFSFLLRDVDRISVSLPIVTPGSPELAFLDEYASGDAGTGPIVEVFETKATDGMLKTFADLNDMKRGNAGSASSHGSFFQELMGNIAQDTQVLVGAKLDSSAKLLDYSNRIFSTILRASFNHYSPVLEAEEIERIRSSSFDYQDEVDSYKPFMLKPSSRVHYDLASGNWVADDGSRTSMPFGMHQIQEEILSPLIQNLMAETRIERMKIYNKIKDQKIDYLNQWHKETNDFYGRNRAEANDLINRMRDALSEYMASYNTYKALQKTDEQMNLDGSLASAKVDAADNSAEALAAFELQANEFRRQQEEFVSFMDRIKEDIDRKAEEFGHIEFYEASLKDEESRKAARSAVDIQNLEPRRKALLSAGSHFAACAAIPPAPRIEERMYSDLSIDLVGEAQSRLSELEKAAAAAKEAEKAQQDNPAAGSAETESGEEE